MLSLDGPPSEPAKGALKPVADAIQKPDTLRLRGLHVWLNRMSM